MTDEELARYDQAVEVAKGLCELPAISYIDHVLALVKEVRRLNTELEGLRQLHHEQANAANTQHLALMAENRRLKALLSPPVEEITLTSGYVQEAGE